MRCAAAMIAASATRMRDAVAELAAEESRPISSASSAASIRQASMTMSWVAEAKATTRAKAPMRRQAAGRARPAPCRPGPAATTSWDSSIQPRRRPSRPSSGTSTRSTIGAQKGFST